MGNEASAPARPGVDSRLHKRFLELAGVAEPRDRVSRDLVVAVRWSWLQRQLYIQVCLLTMYFPVQILAAPGAEDFGALLYDVDERYKGKDLDESAYVHAIATSLGFGACVGWAKFLPLCRSCYFCQTLLLLLFLCWWCVPSSVSRAGSG